MNDMNMGWSVAKGQTLLYKFYRIAWGTVPIRDYAIGLATPDPSGGKIIDILGALDDIATADDAMHDVAESIENLLKDLGFIEE